MNRNKAFTYLFVVICLILLILNITDIVGDERRVPVAKERKDIVSTEGLLSTSLANIASDQMEKLPDLLVDESYSATHYIVEIKSRNLDRDSIAISINDGVILINGKLVAKTNNSSFTSSFSRSFLIRDGFDSTNPQLETTDEGVILKFRRKNQ